MNKEELHAFHRWWYGITGEGNVTTLEVIKLCKEGKIAKLAFSRGIEYQKLRHDKECKCKKTQ